MSCNSQVPTLLKANEAYVAQFDKGNLAISTARKVTIGTCMDARIDPVKILGLEIGDGHVIRNAGGSYSSSKDDLLNYSSDTGRATDALRSLIISQQLVDTREIIVIHHTDCGMLTFKDVDMWVKVKKELHCSADHIAFLTFDNLEDSVREDVQFLKTNPFVLKNIPITGFIYDVKTGKLNQLDEIA